MAIIVTSVSITTPIVANTTGNTYLVLPNVFVTSALDAVNGANSSSSKSIIVHGGLISESNAIDLGAVGTGSFNRVHVTQTGYLFAEGNAVESEGGNLVFLNEFQIVSNFYGVFVSEDFNNIVNTGSIVGASDGIDAFGDFVRITNYGVIQSADEGIEVAGSGTVITNYGSITSTNVAVGNEVIELTNNSCDVATVINFGIISVIEDIAGGNCDEYIVNSGNIICRVSLGSGNDRFDGRGGTIENQDPSLVGNVFGGNGDDEYLIDDAGIDLVELFGEGADTVRTWVSYTMADHIETLILQGEEEIDGIGNDQGNTINGNNVANELSGGDGDDTLNGGWGDDTLNGNDGNDTLRGHSGADRMLGGMGDDTYFVDVIDDQLVEYANEGTDYVFSPVTFALRDYSQHLELLTLTGSGNDGNNLLNGADGNDLLFGGLGNDTFLDDNGIDEMTGGLGDDTYFVDSPFDKLFELAGEGTDSVFSPISFALRDKSQHLENLTLIGTGNVDGTGNSQADTITGNSGDNVLNGTGGNDTLNGGAGDDTYNDDAGADRFEFSVFDGLQNDTIQGFSNTQDTIAIELGAFDPSTVNVAIAGAKTVVTYGDGTSTLLLTGVTLIETDIVFNLS